MIGPGTIETPVLSADQCHTSCAHSTRDRSIPPNAIENSSATADAPVNGRTANSARSISGLSWRAVRTANSASSSTASASTPIVRGLPQPHEPPSTRPSVSAPTPPVISSALSPSGHGIGCPGISGSRRQPAISAATPIGTFTRNTHRQLAATSRPPTAGPSAAANPPTAVHVRTAPCRRSAGKRGQDQPERSRGQQRRAGRLEDAEGDQHRQAGGGGARRRSRDEHRHAEHEAALAAIAVGEAAEQHEQRRVHDRVTVQHPRQPAEAGRAEAPGHLRERDVDDEQVEARQHDAGADDHEDDVGRGGGRCGGGYSGERWLRRA